MELAFETAKDYNLKVLEPRVKELVEDSEANFDKFMEEVMR